MRSDASGEYLCTGSIRRGEDGENIIPGDNRSRRMHAWFDALTCLARGGGARQTSFIAVTTATGLARLDRGPPACLGSHLGVLGRDTHGWHRVGKGLRE